jgi:hypothetical protein
MRPALTLTNKQFGHWTVLRRDTSPSKKPNSPSRWICQCACGTTKSVYSHHLTRARSTSCGCQRPQTNAHHQPKPLNRHNTTPLPTPQTHPHWIQLGGNPPAPIDFYLAPGPTKPLPARIPYNAKHLTPEALAKTTFTDPLILAHVLTHSTFTLTIQEAVELATKLEMKGFKVPT